MKASRIALLAVLLIGSAAGTTPSVLGAPSEANIPGDPSENATSGQEHGRFREILGAAKRRLEDFHRETPLSMEQKKQVRAVLEAHSSEIRAQLEKGRAARRAMATSVKANGPDAPATRQAAEKVGEAVRDGALLKARIGSEIRPILTPEQQKRLDAVRAETETRIDQALDAGPLKH